MRAATKKRNKKKYDDGRITRFFLSRVQGVVIYGRV